MSGFDDEYYKRLQEVALSLSAATKAMAVTPGVTKAVEQMSKLSSAMGATVGIESMQGSIAAEKRMAELTAPMKTALAFEQANKSLLESFDHSSEMVGNAAKALSGFNKISDTIDSKTATVSMIAGLSQVAVAAKAVAPAGVASNLIKAMPNIASVLGDSFSGLDLEALGRATDKAFSDEELSWDDAEVTSRAAQAIADAYNQEPHREVRFDSKDEKIKEGHHLTREDALKWLKYFAFLIELWAAICTVQDHFSSSLEKPKVVYQQQVEITNNYYTKLYGYDSRVLNKNKWRIVNQDIIVRVRHDCHSSVVGRIEAGTPVQIKDRYKKWRQIEWTDDSGEKCLGWIQNWKLQEFEE